SRELTEEALLPFTEEGARRADEGARAQRRVLLMLPGRARAARCARALIRRCAPPSPASQEKGCFRTVRQGPDGEALLPFTGEGARRADEGARAERSVLLMLSGRARAARFARALIRRYAPPSPASQEKGFFRTVRQGPDGEALLPFTEEGARRADEGARAQRSVLLMLPGRARAARFARALIRRFAPPSPASQEKGCFRTVRQGPDGEALLPFTGEGARRADEGARAQRSVLLMLPGKGKSSSLRSRPHPALRATFSRFAGEGLLPDGAAGT